jgi:hypothetical protein
MHNYCTGSQAGKTRKKVGITQDILEKVRKKSEKPGIFRVFPTF